MIASGPGWDLHHGIWQAVLVEVEVDAIVCDPPYGARTHESEAVRNDEVDPTGCSPEYTSWLPGDVSAFVTAWTDRCRGWMVALTSHDLVPAWEQAYADVGRYCFAPVPCVMRGMSVRMLGDGPSSWSVYAVVARPREKSFLSWGTLPGAYTGPRGTEAGGGRGKPDWLMSALVRDYTRPGDLVCDPFAGHGATLAAAVGLKRRAVGSEMDAAAFKEASRRLGRFQQVDLFA